MPLGRRRRTSEPAGSAGQASRGGPRHLIAAFLVLLSGCTAVTEELTAVTSPANLLGKWKGEWGGNMHHPIEVVVEKQQEGKVSAWSSSSVEWRVW